MDKRRKLNPNRVRFFCGSSNYPLAEAVCNILQVPLDKTRLDRYRNDDPDVQLGASVRNRETFIIQSFSPPVDQHLVEALYMLDAARSSSAAKIHLLCPYYSYARSDKKDAPRISIGGRLVAELLQTAGATHIMTMMLHSPQVHGFFGVPIDPLTSRPVLRKYFLGRDLSKTVMVSPDMGQAKSAARFAKDLGDLPVVAGNKERINDTTVRINGIVGDQLKDCNRAIIYDDEICTGGSICEISKFLINIGFKEIWVACTHGVFADGALDRLSAIPEITEIVTTDTVFISPEKRIPKLRVVSVAPIFAEAIRLNYFGESLGDFFTYNSKNL